MAIKLSVPAVGAFHSRKGPHFASSPVRQEMSNDLRAVIRSWRGAAFSLSAGDGLGLGLGVGDDALFSDSPQPEMHSRSMMQQSNSVGGEGKALGARVSIVFSIWIALERFLSHRLCSFAQGFFGELPDPFAEVLAAWH